MKVVTGSGRVQFVVCVCDETITRRMDGGLVVTVTSVLMFAGCFLVGLVPLLFGLSEVCDVISFELICPRELVSRVVMVMPCCSSFCQWNVREAVSPVE